MIYILGFILFCLVGIGIVITISQFLINIYLKSNEIIVDESKISKDDVILSVHIPTRAEPFEVVKDCIESIVGQLSSQDEIIVLDNNHDNLEDYVPLKNYCEHIGIHFEHHDYIPGYKAGALNQALKDTAVEATHILVVDCDYILTDNAINRIKELSSQFSSYGFIQFPQAYNVKFKVDVDNELSKYFNYNLLFNRHKSLGTGTLCCIKKKSLQAIGSWPVESITEDAAFGLKIQELGEYGLYVPEQIGRGYIPTTIRDFYNQRKRWIYGNAEVFFNMIKTTPFNQLKLSNISQLSTWLNFAAFTIISHIIALILTLFGYDMEGVISVAYIHYSIIFIFKMYEFLQLPISLNRQIRAFLIQWQFLMVSSLHWLPVLFNQSKEFIRTPKLPRINQANLQIPITFLVLNILTLIIGWNYLPIVILSIFYILIEIFSLNVLKSNFKQ